MTETNLIDEYFDYQNTYEKRCGPNTLFLMQVGSFFEAYQTQDEGHDLAKISNMLNVILSKRNKSIATVSRKNPYMMGFPVHAAVKYLDVLVENGYTVVLCEQITPPPKTKREVTAIYSPATYIKENTKPDNMYILSIYIEENKDIKTRDKLLSVGLALLDPSTGKSTIHEVYSTVHDDKIALDEAVKFINSYNAKEILLTSKDVTVMTVDKMKQYLEIEDKNHLHKTLEELTKQPGNKLLTNITHQQEMLKVIYPDTINSPIEDLELEHMEYGRNAFVILLKYALDHNRNIINRLDKPEIYVQNKYLHVGNNAAIQLNIFSNGYQESNCSINSLFDVINKTSTPMGRRFLKNSLVQPLVSAKELDDRYELIDVLLQDKKWEGVEAALKEVGDIERWERKMKIGILHPTELYRWYHSQQQMRSVFKMFDKFMDFDLEAMAERQQDMLHDIQQQLVITELQKYHITEIESNIFHEGVHPEVDAIQNEIDLCNGFMDSLADILDRYIDDGSRKEGRLIKVESNERDGHYLCLTKRRCDMLEKELAKSNINEIEVTVGKITQTIKRSKLEFKHAVGKAGNTKIFLPELAKNSDRVVALTQKLKNKLKTLYEKFIAQLVSRFRLQMEEATRMVSIIDFLTGGAKVAHLNRYCRPKIKASDKSSIDVKQLRHPIVERINLETEYVPVDIRLGAEDQDGILLFGLNSAGKSTLQKAVGIAVVMAQIGYFVAARQFTFSPYHSLFTRISGNDNLFKGLSSYTLELMELRAILKRSGQNTLVLADEIASGTEHQSGLIIVMTMIHLLSKSRTSFITATHLHELCDMDGWQDISNVKKYHLHVEFDEKSECLVYDRTLKEGSGSSFYGLQVAKYMMKDKEFLEKANELSQIVGTYTYVSDKQSRYNSKVLMTKCEVCGHKPKKGQIPLETHHIEFQKNADEEGFLKSKPHKHKNHKSNLVVLCSECHDKIDTGELVIKGYKETSRGTKLDYHA